jgi:hypothetical protein
MNLLYIFHTIVKCVCAAPGGGGGGFGPNGFVTKVKSFSMDGYYRTYIISGMGHSRSDSVVPLVLYIVVCNGWGSDIVLQFLRDSTNPAKKG